MFMFILGGLFVGYWIERERVSCQDRAYNLGCKIGMLRGKAEIVGLNPDEEETMSHLEKARKELFSR